MRRILPVLIILGLTLSPAVPLAAVATLTAATAPPPCGPLPTAAPMVTASVTAGEQLPAVPAAPDAPQSEAAATVGCSTGQIPGPPPVLSGPTGDMVYDPTGTGGLVTRPTAHLVAVTRAAFPATGWACWSPRPGTRSEHPLGRACDVTFGNPIGQFPTAAQVAAGWTMTLWLQANTDALHVQYLIWQGHIWNRDRAAEGWRPYTGGGMYDPTHPTGGHYDHLHITIRPT